MKTIMFVLTAAATFILSGAMPPSVSAQGGTSAILITTQGVLGPTGTYIQNTGSFTRLAEGTPTPTPTPGPTPTPTPCVPTPGSPGGILYLGTYMLSNRSEERRVGTECRSRSR